MPQKNTDTDEESPIMGLIRDYAVKHGGLGAADQRESQIAMNIEPSTGTARGYARGGVVTPYPKISQEEEEEGTEGSTDESNDPEFEKMPHLDEGGIAGFDVNTGDSDTLKGIPLNPAAVPPPQMPPAPAAPPPMAAPPAPIAKPMPGMPPGVTPDDLKSYLDTQRAKINKYSPDDQFAQESAMLKARTGFGGRLANAGATFADALMQGVAGKGTPGFAKALNERQSDIAAQQTGAMERARKGTLEQLGETQKIDMEDPGSPLSRTAQKAYSAQLVSAGLPASAVPYMSASLINDVASKQVTLAEALARINEEATYHKGMLEGAAAARSTTAADALAKMGTLGRAMAPKGVVQSLTKTATGQAPGAATPEFANEVQAHAAKLPAGTIVRIGGRRARID